MSTTVNALIIFCEGPHDVAYVRMTLKNLLGFAVKKYKFSEMPSPFNMFFSQSILKHAAADISLDMTHRFFLPESLMEKGENIVLLMNTGGKDKHDKLITFIEPLLPLIGQASTFAEGNPKIVSQVKYLFCYDADTEGLDVIAKKTIEVLNKINKIPFQNDNWADRKSFEFGFVWANVALYVWGDTPEKGTLENILIPLFESDQPVLLKKARTCLEELFPWDTSNADMSISIKECARKSKAEITVIGQRKKYGSSMNVILEQADLLTLETLKMCCKTNAFVDFIKEFAGV